MERKWKTISRFIIIGFVFMWVGCQSQQYSNPDLRETRIAPQTTDWQAERDRIGVLAAYAVVYKGWQWDNERGYNIGSVLLDQEAPEGRLVFWARNCNNITENQTQHGEVRLMLGYLAKLHHARQQGEPVPNIKTLKGYMVYTTLEPCVQCSGMMILQNIARTVYGQSDPGFGKALERLKLDSSRLPYGYPPYPRPVISERSNLLYCDRLEQSYERYCQQHGKDARITDFLKSQDAYDIYKAAYTEFIHYTPKIVMNLPFLLAAQDMVENVPATFVPLQPDI